MSNELTTEQYRALLRQDLMSFIQAAFHELNPDKKFVSSAHLEVIASKLQACWEGKIRRLIINLPPRSLKSHSVSVAFVAWVLGLDPSQRFICASYGQELADKLSRDCRSLMMSPFYRMVFPGTALSRDKQSVSEFVTTDTGYRMATSVGGVLTGRGADFLILDDPLKPDDALSEPRRKGANDWYDNTLITRLDNKNTGCIIVVMQRLHQDDLVGHLIEQGGWEVLSFPAIAEKDECYLIETPWGSKTYRRKEGELLDPKRESEAALKEIRASMGEYNFQSQYQQNPMPPGGLIIKAEWIRYYPPEERPVRFKRILQSWDTANKAGELNDHSVCTTWGEYEKRYYLIDVWRGRVDYPGLKRAVIRQAELHKPQIISIEDKASGTQLIQELKYEHVYYSIKAYEPPKLDKVMRLVSLTTLFEDGKVLLPKSAPWLSEYLLELTSFPGSKHDDQVDSTTQALEYLRSKGPSIYDNL